MGWVCQDYTFPRVAPIAHDSRVTYGLWLGRRVTLGLDFK